MSQLHSVSDLCYAYGAKQAQFISNYSPLGVDFLRRYATVRRTGEVIGSDALDRQYQIRTRGKQILFIFIPKILPQCDITVSFFIVT
jgi:hypothetical protein